MPSLSDLAGLKEYTDQDIQCRDCPNHFMWSAGEQEYYKEYNLAKPVRCPKCRESRKQKNYKIDKRVNGYQKRHLHR